MNILVVMLDLDDEVGLGYFDFFAYFLDEVGGGGAVGNIDSGGSFGSAFIQYTDKYSHQ